MADRGPAEAAGVDALFEEVSGAVLARTRVPLSTYRLQLHGGFSLRAADEVTGYLASLGVDFAYASPLLAATPGSLHGYDVVDPTRLWPELGTEASLERWSDSLRAHGMGLLLDVVPNHMGIEHGNAAWRDVLENGQASAWARVFDIDWAPVKEELRHKVLLPILGDQYGVVLENGELQLEFEAGAFHVRYYDHRLPIAPRQYARVLGFGVEELAARLPPEDAGLQELRSILTALSHLPHRLETSPERRSERAREKEVVKRRLAAACATWPHVGEHVARNVLRFNGRKGDPRSFDLMDGLLSACSYRLAHWRVAAEEINYRRFFDINALAAVRVEDPEVFSWVHALPLRWLGRGWVQGLRVDHPDGLFDPTAYFLELQLRWFLQVARGLRGGGLPPETEARLRARYLQGFSEDPSAPLYRALYLVVEKIQGGRERIPDAWAVHGTTGYRFANLVTGLLVDRSAERALTETWARFVHRSVDFQELVYEKKRLILSTSLASEVEVLARELNRISELNRRSRDFTLSALRRALVEVIALFPVYRTYVDGWRPGPDDRDVAYIEQTLQRARERDPTTNASLFEFLRELLLRRYSEHLGPEDRARMLRFTMRLQQLTGPAMAKGLEDTVFYVYNRLSALNEVGGEPERMGATVEQFHLRNQERAERWPASLLASSTHDTKRSEDVRARLAVLSEFPDEWRRLVRGWARAHLRHKVRVGPHAWPDDNDEYLFYQSVLGAWPTGGATSDAEWAAYVERLVAYMGKAIREAKVHTSWTNPDAQYEQATAAFIRAVLSPRGTFRSGVEPFRRKLERTGQVNALSALVLKLASPGIADFYQGTELWELSLVDPDNRRPVDFEQRAAWLSDLDVLAKAGREGLARQLAEAPGDGRIKLYVTAEGLRLRRRRPALFLRGDYEPVEVTGAAGAHVVAFLRREGASEVLCVAPRLVGRRFAGAEGLGLSLPDTWLRLGQGGAFHHVFTGARWDPAHGDGAWTLPVGELLAAFPVALLERDARST
jgi:(1->4)-alpha-D-glucan 1-alpha-D-glucosylmutase